MTTRLAALTLIAICATAPAAHASLAADWNDFSEKISDTIADPNDITPDQDVAPQKMAVAMFEAANAVEQHYHSFAGVAPAPGANAAEAANEAARTVLVHAFPQSAADIDAFAARIAKPDHVSLELGDRAAALILARVVLDPSVTIAPYRPETTPGHWVPTALPPPAYIAAEKTWLIPDGLTLRPGPPPAAASAAFARDYSETQQIGALHSTIRTAQQTSAARFWSRYDFDPTLRDAEKSLSNLSAQCRLYAMVSTALADMGVTLIGAKLHYMAWRPITAIRNGDIADNPAIQRDASWLPLLKTPMHPEYPCGHCAVGATLATLLSAQPGADPARLYPFKNGTEIRNVSLGTYRFEVSEGRIWGGVHFRSALQAGNKLGNQIGAYALAHFATPK